MAGGAITIASSVVMCLLFLSELHLFSLTREVHELVVDSSRGETISINLDITLPKMPCAWLSLDAMDVSGELHLDVQSHDVFKQRLTAAGHPIKEAEKHDIHSTKTATIPGNATCGACYGAEDASTPCCNTCDEVRSAYRRKGWALSNVEHIDQCKHDAYMESIVDQKGEGCRMWGHLTVNKVAGNFHVAPGRSYQQGNMHVHDVAPFGPEARMDFAHTINKLSFGPTYAGMLNPLDAVRQDGQAGGSIGMFQYFLKVVPTSVSRLSNSTVVNTNQFAVTENFRDSQGSHGTLPGVFWFYDLSPIKVHIREKRSTFLHFLTSVCAIVGGVFTVAGILDALLHTGQKLIKKKQELGKFT
eukprot:CAMPEP_0119106818 /NCGR_PEP_ID=MMETSP1180-20130426/6334_1 /TAXON_ID=3052 ORGANISM="Chlamydomonas cf sp, Strain CCMP681" /NCGR_SAMPLE_ID=MMETSP1180 /ASSEMBLY_ACC=CAM_ASM_000741 /LENGTH=357 /DNA_ID=CAMNT_0007092209 /DNA_START=168 /DNA_END=1241 /DNA_ORIENTATION=-